MSNVRNNGIEQFNIIEIELFSEAINDPYNIFSLDTVINTRKLPNYESVSDEIIAFSILYGNRNKLNNFKIIYGIFRNWYMSIGIKKSSNGNYVYAFYLRPSPTLFECIFNWIFHFFNTEF